MKKSFITMAAATLFAATFISSCNKEADNPGYDGRYVGFSVSAAEQVDTKAHEQTAQTFEISEGEVSLYITASKSINNDNPFEGRLSTKGVEKKTKDVAEGFTMSMLTSEGDLYRSGTVKKDNEGHSYWSFFDGNDKIAWPADAENGAKYSFVSCVPEDSRTSFSSYPPRQVAYTGPEHAEGKNNDAEKSEDLLIAYTEGVQHDHKKQNLVDMRFYHPLAAVVFHVSESVKKITISGVRKDGTFQYNAVDSTDVDDFKKAFEWTVSSSDDNLADYIQEVKSEDVDSKTNLATYEFFLIPHTFPSNVKEDVKITFDVEDKKGNIHQISTLANNLGTSSWDAGYRYNYYINETSDGKVGVAVSETWADFVKTNVGVENVKRSTAYVRAKVVANWETAKGKVVSSFNGTIVYNTESYWVEGDDGFYYYTQPLVGFATTDPLIKSFKDDSKNSDLNFQLSKFRLVWHIVAQGVEYDENKTYVDDAWDDVSVGGKSLVSMLETE